MTALDRLPPEPLYRFEPAAHLHGYTGMAAVIYDYPPAVWDYARRVGRETVHSVIDAAEQGRRLLLAGMDSHLRATAACPKMRLEPVVLPDLSFAPSVEHAAAAVIVIDLVDGLELRTPPSEWLTAPPRELFEPRDGVLVGHHSEQP